LMKWGVKWGILRGKLSNRPDNIIEKATL
jgi:hypothetical protein